MLYRIVAVLVYVPAIYICAYKNMRHMNLLYRKSGDAAGLLNRIEKPELL